MYQIGLLAEVTPLRHRLKQQIESDHRFVAEVFSQPTDLLAAVKRNEVSAIVFVVERFKESHIETLKVLRYQLQGVSLVMVSSCISQELRKSFSQEKIKGVTIIDQRFELADLNSLVMSLLNGAIHPFREHCRYQVYKRAQLLLKTGLVDKASVVNLSYGGAQIKLHQEKELLGEWVVVNVLSGNHEVHRLEGRVVWANNNERLYGVEFTRRKSGHLRIVDEERMVLSQ